MAGELRCNEKLWEWKHTKKLEIRFAKEVSEASEAEVIGRQAYAGVMPIFPDAYLKDFHRGDLIVALYKGKVVGFLTAKVTVNCIFFGDMGVLKEYRGKGIASAIMDFVKELSDGRYPIVVKTEMAAGFYLKNGWIIRGEDYSKKGLRYNILVYGDMSEMQLQRFLRSRGHGKRTISMKYLLTNKLSKYFEGR